MRARMQMYNILAENLTFRSSFSIMRHCLVEFLSFFRCLFFLPYARQRPVFRWPMLCQIESLCKTIYVEVRWMNHKSSMWKESLPFGSNQPDLQISRSIGWTRMQSNSYCFVGAVTTALNNTTTSHHTERLLTLQKLHQTERKKFAMCWVWLEKMTSQGCPRRFLWPGLKH